MSVTHSITYTHNRGVGTDEKVKTSVVAEGEINIDVDVPDGSTDFEIAFAVTRDALLSLFIIADGTLTLKTNDSGAPDDTLSLTAQQIIAWNSHSLGSDPFAEDVTVLFATNAGDAPVNLKIFAAVDATP